MAHANKKPPASLQALPKELVEKIAADLNQVDISNLVLLCKQLAPNACSILYNSPHLQSCNNNRYATGVSIGVAQDLKQLCRFLRTIRLRRDLSDSVVNLKFTIHTNRDTYPASRDDVEFCKYAAQLMGFDSIRESPSTLVIRDGLHAQILSLCPNLRTLEIELDILAVDKAAEVVSYEPPTNAVATLCKPIIPRLSFMVNSALLGKEPRQRFSRLEQLEIRSVPPCNALIGCLTFVSQLLEIPSLRKYTSASFLPAEMPNTPITTLDLKNGVALTRQPGNVSRNPSGSLHRPPVDPKFLHGCHHLQKLTAVASDTKHAGNPKAVTRRCDTLLSPVAATLRHIVLHIPPSTTRSFTNLTGTQYLQHIDLTLLPSLEIVEVHWEMIATLTHRSIQNPSAVSMHTVKKIKVFGCNPLNLFASDWKAIKDFILNPRIKDTFPNARIYVWVELPDENGPAEGRGKTPVGMIKRAKMSANRALFEMKVLSLLPLEFGFRIAELVFERY